MSRTWSGLFLAAGLGAVSGMRSMSGLALISRRLSHHGGGRRPRTALVAPFRSKSVSNLLAAMAAVEIAADKTPMVPNRTDPLPLIGRAGLGALTGLIAADCVGTGRTAPAAVGAAAAVASAFLFYRIRKTASERFPLPGWMIAAAEDALVLGAGSRFAAALTERRR